MNIVDLFDPLHAAKVLADFGRAYGRLPEHDAELSSDQRAFIGGAVEGLCQNGRVICVRLSLLADMMKGRPWTSASLREVGGTSGLGITFLEETFSAATSPAQHRVHEQAARTVLKTLLPELVSVAEPPVRIDKKERTLMLRVSHNHVNKEHKDASKAGRNLGVRGL